MTLNCIFLKKLSFIGKLSSDYGLLSKMKSNLEDLYLNIKQCILILLKNYTIWSHNLVLLLLKKGLYFVKSRLWASMNRKVSAAVPNFGRGFSCIQLTYILLSSAASARLLAVSSFSNQISSSEIKSNFRKTCWKTWNRTENSD